MSIFSLSKPKKMHDILDFHFQNDPDSVSVSFNATNYSNKIIYNNVNSLMSNLKNRGLVPGDRVAILSKNNVAFIELLYAASKFGLVLVPINFRLAYPEINFILACIVLVLRFRNGLFQHVPDDLQLWDFHYMS